MKLNQGFLTTLPFFIFGLALVCKVKGASISRRQLDFGPDKDVKDEKQNPWYWTPMTVTGIGRDDSYLEATRFKLGDGSAVDSTHDEYMNLPSPLYEGWNYHSNFESFPQDKLYDYGYFDQDTYYNYPNFYHHHLHHYLTHHNHYEPSVLDHHHHGQHVLISRPLRRLKRRRHGWRKWVG